MSNLKRSLGGVDGAPPAASAAHADSIDVAPFKVGAIRWRVAGMASPSTDWTLEAAVAGDPAWPMLNNRPAVDWSQMRRI